MNLRFKTAAAVMLATSLLATSAYAQAPAPATKNHAAAKKVKTPPPPTVEEQIKTLRDELEGQINGLKDNLAAKDAQLKQAQQAAADAQAAADKAQAAASAQQQAVTENASAVTTLQSTVTDLKANNVSLATTVSDETAKIKKSFENPGALHYKGITLTPGGFVAGETIFRTHATGGGITTPFNALPYESGDAYLLSEFYGEGRQSRLSLQAEGKTSWGTLKGYYEADFLGTGTSSNANQSNSYVLRQRILYASATTNAGWTVGAGQLWSLAAEGKKGIVIGGSSDVNSPQNIDPSYVAGFVFTRQYGLRVIKNFDKAAFAFGIENPQLLYTASLAGNTPYAVLGSAGANGGAFNATISGCSPSTSIVNYTNQQVTDSDGDTVNIAVPVYKTVNSCANVANISFNQAPDVLAKFAFDPGWGHYEIFGIAGFAHETVYPGETTNSNLYGGLTDIVSGLTVAPSLTTTGYTSSSLKLGGVGGSFRVPLVKDLVSVGAKGLLGPGMGHYGASNLADVTADANGDLKAIHNVSGLLTLEVTPNPRLILWADYGGDYAGREDYAGVTGANGLPTTLGGPKAAQNPTTTLWGGTWKAPSAAAVGYGSRLLNNSACLTLANPGYNGSSTGYYPGGSCGAQTRDVQEIAGGYWYDIYKGDRGRFRQGFQYGYTVREGWSGAPLTAGTPGIGAKGTDNMFWTSLRYYLP